MKKKIKAKISSAKIQKSGSGPDNTFYGPRKNPFDRNSSVFSGRLKDDDPISERAEEEGSSDIRAYDKKKTRNPKRNKALFGER